MKSRIFNITTLLLLISVFIITSCEKESDLIQYEESRELTEFNFNHKTKYDSELEKLAIAINKGLKNDDFKSILTKATQNGYTNDYDAPIQKLINNPTYKTTAGLDVGRFIDEILYPERKGLKSSGGTTFLDSLSNAYPELMISIPVNIEMMEGGVKPYVLYIPENFTDGTYKSIRALDPNGEVVYLSLEEEPEFPVVVIRENEYREYNKSEHQLLKASSPSLKTKVEYTTPEIRLKAETHDAGVQVSWIRWFQITEYRLYRYSHEVKQGVDQEGYEYVKTFTNSHPGYYVDEKTYSSMPTNQYYPRYKMIVTLNTGETINFYSTINETIADVKIGDVASQGNRMIQVNWSKITDDKLVGYNIYRASSVTSANTDPRNVWDNGWLLCNNQMVSPHLTSWTDFDDQKIAGKAYFYRVLPRTFSNEQNWQFQAASNAEASKYINLAICSDRSDNAQLIATHMKTKDISKLEGWIYGKPEFVFAVYGYSNLDASFNSNNAKKIGEFTVSGIKRKYYNKGFSINRTMLLKWSNELNLEIISVVGYEHDDETGSWDAIAMQLKNLAIDLVEQTVQTRAGVDISSLTDVLKSRRGDTYAGGAYIIRSGKENVTLKLDQGKGGKDQKQYPAGGVMLRISTSTDGGSWSDWWDNDIIQLEDDQADIEVNNISNGGRRR